ncbi:MAG: hypothetical protein M1820_006727 [Bogoriella megaspora]|nr:MAG: hypothetical protein M1820_006727 [Bogoriella megaspora]
MSNPDKKQGPTVTVTEARPRTSSSSSVPSLKSPRTARFAEATSVNSPLEPTAQGRSPFADPVPPTNHYQPQAQPSDFGFGYMAESDRNSHGVGPIEMEETDPNYLAPTTPGSILRSPLKSAMKSPGAKSFGAANPLSPTFREEQILEKHEVSTEKVQAQDLKIKFRVRMAKMFLRGVNFSCSLIVLSLLSSTFSIFNATRHLPSRSNFTAWAPNQKIWPQVTLLVIACISLAMAIAVFYGYWKGGHRRAEKVAVYYTVFAVVIFVFSIVMWGIGAAVLNQSKANGGGKDMWGWSCVDNKRKTLFQEEVDYDLICRLQNWSLVCAIIEIVVETITILIYGIVFYRFYSKRQLRKSMATRDKARSDLYLAQLRSQSAPNTPGGPLSPRDGGWRPPIDYYAQAPNIEDGINTIDTNGVQYASLNAKMGGGAPSSKPFQLQAPPIRIQGATPKMQQNGFESQPMQSSQASPPVSPTLPPAEIVNEHMHAAPGEHTYDAVPIPGAYVAPGSPPPQQQGFGFPPPHAR